MGFASQVKKRYMINNGPVSLENIIAEVWETFAGKLDSNPTHSGNTITDFEVAVLNIEGSLSRSQWENYSYGVDIKLDQVLPGLRKYIIERQSPESFVDLYTNPHFRIRPGTDLRISMATRVEPLTKDAVLKWWEDVKALKVAEANTVYRQDDISSQSMKRQFQSYVQEHYLKLTRSVIPEKEIHEVLNEDPVVQALLRAGQEVHERDFRIFIVETLAPFMRMLDEADNANDASRATGSGIVETNG